MDEEESFSTPRGILPRDSQRTFLLGAKKESIFAQERAQGYFSLGQGPSLGKNRKWLFYSQKGVFTEEKFVLGGNDGTISNTGSKGFCDVRWFRSSRACCLPKFDREKPKLGRSKTPPRTEHTTPSP